MTGTGGGTHGSRPTGCGVLRGGQGRPSLRRNVGDAVPYGAVYRIRPAMRVKKESPYGLSFFAVYTPSFSSAASFRQVQNTAMACSSSATGGRDGAMRMLLSWGSLP